VDIQTKTLVTREKRGLHLTVRSLDGACGGCEEQGDAGVGSRDGDGWSELLRAGCGQDHL